MRVATWNVNSLKARLPRVEEWLSIGDPDVLCMQETKLADSAFPAMAFQAHGYEAIIPDHDALQAKKRTIAAGAMWHTTAKADGTVSRS